MIFKTTMTNTHRKLLIQAIAIGQLFLLSPLTFSYEVAVGLGSTADYSATIAMQDREQWPVVADLSWGPLANLYPIGLLTRDQQQAVFKNFKQRRAITELPFPSIRWTSSQPDIDFIKSFDFSIPYVFVLYEYHERVRDQGQATADALKAAGVIDSMLTRSEILRLKQRFPDKKVIMNTRSWTRNKQHLKSVEDIVDGIVIEFIPQNLPEYIAFDVAPFAEWAHNNDKVLMFLMPPVPDDYLEDRYVKAITRSVQTIYDENIDRLPKGWMKSDKLIFVPANYSWEKSRLTYIPEDSENSVLAAAKALLMMRPELDAGPVRPGSKPNAGVLGPILLLLE